MVVKKTRKKAAPKKAVKRVVKKTAAAKEVPEPAVPVKEIPVAAAPKSAPKPKGSVYIAIGRRKSAAAQVKLEMGDGKVIVNGKDPQKYFTSVAQRRVLQQPLEIAGLVDRVNLAIKTKGGGMQAQAEAARLGISRAIILLDKEHRAVLKAVGYLRRDSREKERKKPGLKRARRAPQFSKR